MKNLKYIIFWILILLAIPIVESFTFKRVLVKNDQRKLFGKCTINGQVIENDYFNLCQGRDEMDSSSDAVSMKLAPDKHTAYIIGRGVEASHFISIFGHYFPERGYVESEMSKEEIVENKTWNRKSLLSFKVEDANNSKLKGLQGIEEILHSFTEKESPTLPPPLMWSSQFNWNLMNELGLLAVIALFLLFASQIFVKINRSPASAILRLANLLPKGYSDLIVQEISDLRIESDQALTERKVLKSKYIITAYYLGLSWSFARLVIERIIRNIPKQS